MGDRKHVSSHRKFHVAGWLSVIFQYVGVCLDHAMVPADGCLREMSLPSSSADIQGESQVPEHIDLMLSDVIWGVPVSFPGALGSPIEPVEMEDILRLLEWHRLIVLINLVCSWK